MNVMIIFFIEIVDDQIFNFILQVCKIYSSSRWKKDKSVTNHVSFEIIQDWTHRDACNIQHLCPSILNIGDPNRLLF